jgi:hypothetical protein
MSKVEGSRKRQKTGGRVKGVPNKVTGALKDMILTALDKSGGIEYLQAQARDNPTAFLTLVGKVLPLQVNADFKGEITQVTHRIID